MHEDSEGNVWEAAVGYCDSYQWLSDSCHLEALFLLIKTDV